MATVKASELGIARLRHAQESSQKSWEVVAEESFVARSTILTNLLKGKPVDRDTVLALAKYFELERREIVTDREWYPQFYGHDVGQLWKLLMDAAGEQPEKFWVIKAADKSQLVREYSTLGAIPYRSSVPKANRVSLNEEINFCVDVPQAGHLVLLEREPNGSIVCLSPSEFVRQNSLGKGLSILPQVDNPYNLEAFGATELGREELIACLLPDVPQGAELGWLETSRQAAMGLGVEQLVTLLGCVVEGLHAQLWKLNYEVVNE